MGAIRGGEHAGLTARPQPVTVEDALDAARRAHEAEVFAWKAAAFVLADADETILRALTGDGDVDDDFLASLREAKRLAKLLATSHATEVETSAIGDVVEVLFDACGRAS